MPTLFLTNYASLRDPTMRGPGRTWSILALPPWFVRRGTVGTVWALTPLTADLRAYRDGQIDLDEYRRRCVGSWDDPTLLTAGLLCGAPHPLPRERLAVSDGDTLVCTCARAEAEAGRCHRVWSADLLRRAGWRVVLDGERVTL